MRIQKVCGKTGLSKRNIHYYIKEKLITPAVNEENGYYDFKEKDCQRLILISVFRNAGLSISIIRSLLDTPTSAGYYLRIHTEKLRKERQHLEQTIDSLDHILDALPINPDFDILYRLSTEADIPGPVSELSYDSDKDFDNHLVNHFLWRGFLPENSLSEYQQFLWYKIHLMTSGSNNQDYWKIGRFLRTLSQESVDKIYSGRIYHYNYIAELKETDYHRYAKEMQDNIRKFLDNHATVNFWRSHYEDYVCPDIRIYTSEVSAIVAEMSPFFAAYVRNINAVCDITYSWLLSENGAVLLEKMRKTLGECMNLEHCNHGELESMACLHQLA